MHKQNQRQKHEQKYLDTIAEQEEKIIELEDRSSNLNSQYMKMQVRVARYKMRISMQRLAICLMSIITAVSLLAALR